MTQSTKTPHPYADILRAIADGKQVQFLSNASVQLWEDTEPGEALREISITKYPPSDYRIKPKTIRIGEYDVPEPLRAAPVKDAEYFRFDLGSEGWVHSTQWGDYDCEVRWLQRGILHSTKEAAELHAKALLSLSASK